jgi:uncharacterized protein YecE (DUF72 family)
MMDARGLHAGHSLAQADVRARKPNLPVVMRATATFEEGRHFVEPWAPQLARWISDGKQPYFFMHAPDDTFAPENAYAFHAMLQQHADVGELPPLPTTPRQMDLF